MMMMLMTAMTMMMMAMMAVTMMTAMASSSSSYFQDRLFKPFVHLVDEVLVLPARAEELPAPNPCCSSQLGP
eukprot:12412230-Karenia_brevis.AAC.1